MAETVGAEAPQPAAPTYEGFQRVQKNRNAAIHWLLQLTHRIEKEWANEDSRMADLQLLKHVAQARVTSAGQDP